MRDLLSMLESESINGKLWIVEAGRIRVREDTQSVDSAPDGG